MILEQKSNNPLYSFIDRERLQETPVESARGTNRDDFERDYGRIVHSSAFRRLQSKTQVIGTNEGDFHRTRLTHSMEVAQIARGIVTFLNQKLKDIEGHIDTSLVETASLAHDLGHPPFGHQGERALHKNTVKYGGFEGNAQTFRILTRLEGNPYGGLHLTRATLLSILKYPILFQDALNGNETSSKPPKANIYDEDKEIFQWVIKEFTQEEQDFFGYSYVKDSYLKTKNKSLECSVIELADDIAYATHDLQDALKFGLISLKDVQSSLDNFINVGILKSTVTSGIKLDPSDSDYKYQLKDFFADLINLFISNVSLTNRKEDGLSSPRLKYLARIDNDCRQLMKVLNDLVYKKVISSQRVQTMEWKGGHIIDQLFQAMMNEKNLLPEDIRSRWSDSEHQNVRLVCDYIAGMTDSFASKMHTRLFQPEGSRLFDI